jgi:hypothetical protein
VPKWTASLGPLEEELLVCAASGKMFDPRPSDARPMKDWGSERTIRAEVLAHLLVETEWAIQPKGVEIRAVKIEGHLDLEAATVRCPLYLKSCYLDDDRPVSLDLATFPTLALLRCYLPGLSGISLTVTKGLDLSRSVLTESLNLTQAAIGGGLYCRATRLKGVDAQGFAFSGDGMTG